MAITLAQYRTQFQEPMRDALVELIWQSSTILPLLHFIPTDDLQYSYSNRTALPAIAFRAINGEYAGATGNYSKVTEDLGIFGQEIKTDARLVENRGSVARDREVQGVVRAAGLFYDKFFFDGDKATVADQFNGLNVRLTGGRLLTAATNGATLTLDMIDNLLTSTPGPNSGKTLLMNRWHLQKLNALIRAAAGGASLVEVANAMVVSYRGAMVKVVEVDHTNAQILGFDETVGSSNICSSIYCVRFGGAVDETDVQGLLGSNFMQVKDEGQRGTAYYDILDCAMGLGIFGSESATRLRGILNG
jgi:hypothetical protein